jgi:hypothetical protein
VRLEAEFLPSQTSTFELPGSRVDYWISMPLINALSFEGVNLITI